MIITIYFKCCNLRQNEDVDTDRLALGFRRQLICEICHNTPIDVIEKDAESEGG